jgi:hypothetical protein
VIEVRHESPDGPAARALFAAYMELVRERAGSDFQPAEHIFATPEVFSGPGSAWLVVYEDGEPVACGGLRPLAPDTGEIKRMFVASAARPRGPATRSSRATARTTTRTTGWKRVYDPLASCG